jgi:hypothetical protein
MVLGQDSTPYYYRKGLWRNLPTIPKMPQYPLDLPNPTKIDWSMDAIEKSKLERKIKEVLEK